MSESSSLSWSSSAGRSGDGEREREESVEDREERSDVEGDGERRRRFRSSRRLRWEPSSFARPGLCDDWAKLSFQHSSRIDSRSTHPAPDSRLSFDQTAFRPVPIRDADFPGLNPKSLSFPCTLHEHPDVRLPSRDELFDPGGRVERREQVVCECGVRSLRQQLST